MIRSSQTTLKFTNSGKKETIYRVIDEYRNVVCQFVDLTWDLPQVSPLLDKTITSQVETWLSERLIQCAGKQASGIVRGTRQKQKQRLYKLTELESEGDFKNARRLREVYEKTKVSKPKIQNVQMELDPRFVEIDLDNPTSFDGWITLTSLGDKIKIKIPFKKSKHFNKLSTKGLLKRGIRLSKRSVTFMFDIPDVEAKTEGSVLGIDVGKTTTISCSNGFTSKPNNHGHDLNSILSTMSRKKKGSKAFNKCQNHRTNYVNWSINQLNINQFKQVNIEDIKQLRKFKRSSRNLSHWTYTEIFDKLESYCAEQGVLVQTVSPTYTSQRCFECGWTRKSNRKGKLFKCTCCGHTADADLNASKNISLSLRPIGAKERRLHKNKIGFYLTEVGQEYIVPDVQKTKINKK